MKKYLALIFMAFTAFACQQKEDSKPQYQFPSGLPAGPVQTQPGQPNPMQSQQMQAQSFQSQEEEKLLREAMGKDPKNLNALIKFGNLTMDSGRFDEAIDAYVKALVIDPKNVDVRVDLGTCYKNAGKPDLAVKEYRKALELDPRHPNAHRNLAVVLENDLRDRAQAIKEFEAYLRVTPNAADRDSVQREIDKLKASK